ncbi:ATP-dependent chaperone protein ClpB [Escherichia coli]|uniref:ATP-dependent chaperone protein ClpB n=1 Tax=Escherichia coli TaxID=562 RepID=A0A2X1KX74_ECOLX|nr:ATP-dependent chaperone protein ClpB [Escherichia coli]
MAEVISSRCRSFCLCDEAHTLIGAGNQQGGLDISNLLKPALARGELKTIAATTWSEYKNTSKRCRPVAPLPVGEGQRTQRCRSHHYSGAVCRRSMNSLTAC